MDSLLFTSFQMRGLTLANRVVVSPMAQYSAVEGSATDWHLMHLGKFAVSGSGLMITEATAISAIGRIGVHCLGIYNDDNEQALARVVDFCKTYGNVPIGIQLAHSGRKASTIPPWKDRQPVAPEQGGWKGVAPSAADIPDGLPPPTVLDEEGMAQIKAEYVEAAKRSERAGFDVVEVHAAHGYLLNEFLSPITNRRNDEYGGDLENRMRYPLEVFAAVRAVFPDDKPVGIRISATDWIKGGWEVSDSIAFAQAVQALGCDYLVASSGGVSPEQELDVGPGYQVPFAARIKAETDMPIMAVGLIDDARQAETIVRSGQADLVALGRGMLYDPHWTWHAAAELGATAAYPIQYERAHPSLQNNAIPGDTSLGRG